MGREKGSEGDQKSEKGRKKVVGKKNKEKEIESER